MCRKPVGEGANRVTIPLFFALADTQAFSSYYRPVKEAAGVRRRVSSIASRWAQTGFSTGGARALWQRARSLADGWLTEQAPQFALWLPVSPGLGVSLWFVLHSPGLWIAALGAFGAIAAGGSALGGRVGRLALWVGLVAAIGLSSEERRVGYVAVRPCGSLCPTCH